MKVILVSASAFNGMVSINDFIYIDESCLVEKNKKSIIIGVFFHEAGHLEPRK